MILSFPAGVYSQSKEQIKIVMGRHGLKWNVRKMLRTETQFRGVWEDRKNSVTAEFNGHGGPATLTVKGDNEQMIQELRDLAEILGAEVFVPGENSEVGCQAIFCLTHDPAAKSYCLDHLAHRERWAKGLETFKARMRKPGSVSDMVGQPKARVA